MEKFTFTEEIYSLILLLPKYKRNKAIKDVINYGLYEIPIKASKRYQPIMENIIKPIREEKTKRFVAQINGQQGGRKTNKKKQIIVQKTNNNQAKTKINQEKSKIEPKLKQKKPTKIEVNLFCIANGYSLSNDELTELYRSVMNSSDWRQSVKEQLIKL